MAPRLRSPSHSANLTPTHPWLSALSAGPITAERSVVSPASPIRFPSESAYTGAGEAKAPLAAGSAPSMALLGAFQRAPEGSPQSASKSLLVAARLSALVAIAFENSLYTPS